MTPTSTTKQRVNNKRNLVRLLEGMLTGTRTNAELADYTGMHYHTVIEFTAAMRKAGVAHVAGWRKDSRGMDRTAVLQLGPGLDAPRRRLTDSQRTAAYVARKRAAAEAAEPLSNTGRPLVPNPTLENWLR
jgi:hypothetical protein